MCWTAIEMHNREPIRTHRERNDLERTAATIKQKTASITSNNTISPNSRRLSQNPIQWKPHTQPHSIKNLPNKQCKKKAEEKQLWAISEKYAKRPNHLNPAGYKSRTSSCRENNRDSSRLTSLILHYLLFTKWLIFDHLFLLRFFFFLPLL